MSDLAEIDPPAGRRARAKAANRQAILEAARRVFASIGYEATSVRDIIRETELAAGTFYNYFRSKEEVFEALASESTLRFRPLLQQVRREARDLETYIHSAYRAYFQFLHDENVEAIREGAPHMALIGVRVDTPEMQSVVDEVRNDLECYFARGEPAQIDTVYLTAAAVGIAREIGNFMLMRRPLDIDEAAQFATQLLLGGLARVSNVSGR